MSKSAIVKKNIFSIPTLGTLNVHPGINPKYKGAGSFWAMKNRDFTLKLQDLLLNQTNLDLVNSSGDLIFEGEIVEYYIAPITATSEITAAQNRLTIIINVRFYNTKEELKDFDQRFRFYYDYPGSSQLVGSQKDEAINVIFERITQDIFNASLANW